MWATFLCVLFFAATWFFMYIGWPMSEDGLGVAVAETVAPICETYAVNHGCMRFQCEAMSYRCWRDTSTFYVVAQPNGNERRYSIYEIPLIGTVFREQTTSSLGDTGHEGTQDGLSR